VPPLLVFFGVQIAKKAVLKNYHIFNLIINFKKGKTVILLGKRDGDDDATIAAQVYKDIFQADVHCIIVSLILLLLLNVPFMEHFV
jgi:hypothetical protein